MQSLACVLVGIQFVGYIHLVGGPELLPCDGLYCFHYFNCCVLFVLRALKLQHPKQLLVKYGSTMVFAKVKQIQSTLALLYAKFFYAK